MSSCNNIKKIQYTRIVGVDNVTNRIKDNSIISINVSTGVIKIFKSQEEKR